jgi:hypothetical protein
MGDFKSKINANCKELLILCYQFENLMSDQNASKNHSLKISNRSFSENPEMATANVKIVVAACGVNKKSSLCVLFNIIHGSNPAAQISRSLICR